MAGCVGAEDEIDRRSALNTPRLVIRAPHADDLPALVALANNPRVAENLASMPHPFTQRDAQAWLDRARPAVEAARFVILHNGAVIGGAGFGRLEADAVCPDIGYWLGEPYWGRGFGTEAVQAVIDHAFATTTLTQLLAGCRVTNRASRRVLQKCGFQYFGDDLIQSRYFASCVAVHRFRLERVIWASLKAWGAAGK